jgi:hypothetical protein
VASGRARWHSSLRYAFAKTEQWPPLATGETTARPSPVLAASSPTVNGPDRVLTRLQARHIAELHDQDQRLQDGLIPTAIRSDVEAIRSQGFRVEPIGVIGADRGIVWRLGESPNT